MVKFAVIQGNRPRGSVGERTLCRSAESGTARSPFPNRTRRLKLSPCLEPCADSDIPSRALLYILMVGVQHVYHYVVTQTKSLFLFFQALFLHLVEFVILKRRASEQENAGIMTVHIRLYTPIVETQHTEDGCATPMQHQWRAPPSMSFVQVFLHSMFRRLRCTSQFAKTPHFDTYSSVVFRSHCQEIPHVSFTR